MKKLVIMALLVSSAAVASAAEIGLRIGRQGGVESLASGITSQGVTVGQKFGAYGAEVAYDRSMVGTSSMSRYSLVGSYDVAKVVGATVAAKAGVAYIDPTAGVNGYAALVGVGVSYPLTPKISLVADYAYQQGQSRVYQYNGNNVSVGVKYAF